MKTFISDIIPKLQNFSQKLDNVTLLTNQHWVIIDNIVNNKIVYIFRTNNDLLISENGKVEKAKWEYLGNHSLLIEKKEEIYLYKHGFFDENILALKVDSKDEYAFLINENKYDAELNSIECVIDFLTKKYNSQNKEIIQKIEHKNSIIKPELILLEHKTNKGILDIEQSHKSYFDVLPGQKVFQDGQIAPDGKYKLEFMWYIHIKNGIIVKTTIF